MAARYYSRAQHAGGKSCARGAISRGHEAVGVLVRLRAARTLSENVYGASCGERVEICPGGKVFWRRFSGDFEMRVGMGVIEWMKVFVRESEWF